MITEGSIVQHRVFGQCTVVSIVHSTQTVIIRRSDINRIEECFLSDLTLVDSVSSSDWNSLQETILRIQSALITSINSTWGIFSQTLIQLLPHQLWVCNQTLKRWPTRMMIADDVGLGKTMEAGIILLAAIQSAKAKRVLILAPAGLTDQWQRRLNDAFNLKFNIYRSDQRRNSTNYWQINNFVIASMQTVRMGTNGIVDDLLEADPWDFVFVDEAHHIGVSKQGQTLGYQMFKKLDENNKIESALFFTATPHQGISENFWGLMELLNPAEFSLRRPLTERNDALCEYMIRNSKAQVVDMEGNLLFHKVTQYPHIFQYTEAEALFYNTMTEFISSGYAYANSQDDQLNKQITLVLIALQKIASSSISAITHALAGRIRTIGGQSDSSDYLDSDEGWEDDEEESIPKKQKKKNFQLMAGEVAHLHELIGLANRVKKESKILAIMDIIEEKYPVESILFFTEYKATQALMVQSLRDRYGKDQVGFINGDGCLSFGGLPERNDRDLVMRAFNDGSLRFLVSTEASSEGVDLQSNCHVLIHVDLPWNPMRMHQRVGRIYRFGQKKDVDVITVRNPDNIESRIWNKLDTKIRNIMSTFDKVMKQPEDLLQLVIGMEDARFYESLFSEALRHQPETVDEWFDQKMQTFGKKSALDTLGTIAGNASHFDLSSLHGVPRLDLENLRPFMVSALALYGKRNRDKGESLSFITPFEWRGGPNGKQRILIRDEYEGLVFSRSGSNVKKLCAVGCLIFDTALIKVRNLESNHALLPGTASYLVFRVFERVTTEQKLRNEAFVAYLEKDDGSYEFVSDVDLFKITEKLTGLRDKTINSSVPSRFSTETAEELMSRAIVDYRRKGICFEVPDAELFAYLQGCDERG